MYSLAQIFGLSLTDMRASKSIATLEKFTSLGLSSVEFDIDIPADIYEMLAISAALAVPTLAEASTDAGLGLAVVGLADRTFVTAIVTRLAKSVVFMGPVACCAAETSAKSLEAVEDGGARFVILAAVLPDCLEDFLLGGMT